jgi:Domain of unknown function (DUF4266)
MSAPRCVDALRGGKQRQARIIRRALLALSLALGVAGSSGCAAHAVQAYRRENLADPIMSFKQAARRDARRIKTFEAREGSTGGSGGEGGGCACK